MKIFDIISKIKNFFRIKNTKLLNESTNTELVDVTNNEKNLFMENVEVKPDTEKLNLLKLQEQLEKGTILEEDLTKEDAKKLNILYDEQITKLKRKIEQTKNETRYILDKMKKLQQV